MIAFPYDIALSLGLGNLGFHLAILFPCNVSSGVPLIENVERLPSWLLVVSAVRSVGIAPVSDARKQQKDKAEPKKPAPAEIPVVPISMCHFDSPSDKANRFLRKSAERLTS
jgi:hypothetical protein